MFQSREKASQKYSEIIVRKLQATALDAVVFYYGKIHASADENGGEFCYSDHRIIKKENNNDRTISSHSKGSAKYRIRVGLEKSL
jgi:hypothetical protein